MVAFMDRRKHLLVVLLGLGTLVLGGLAIAGYALHMAPYVRLWPDAPAMPLAAAAGLVLGGAGLIIATLAESTRLRQMVVGLGTLVACIGVAGGVEHVFGIDLGIDFPALHAAIGVTGAQAGHPAPATCVAFVFLGGCLATLGLAGARRAALPVTTLATACAAFGATSLAGYVMHVEFLVSWPSRTPPSPQTALGIALLGFGVCCAVLRRAAIPQQQSVHSEARSIRLTAVWVLTLIAIAAGISTFALAQYEFESVVRADLARTLRDRRAFLEYAIEEHAQQVSLGARPPFAASGGNKHRASQNAAIKSRLQASADALTQSNFSGWRFEGTDMDMASLLINLKLNEEQANHNYKLTRAFGGRG